MAQNQQTQTPLDTIVMFFDILNLLCTFSKTLFIPPKILQIFAFKQEVTLGMSFYFYPIKLPQIPGFFVLFFFCCKYVW